MPAHFDEPDAHSPVDPLGFFVRGWLWLGAEHPGLVGVEAWCDEQLVGETRALYPRPDVAAAFNLARPDRLGFELFGHHPAAAPGEPLRLELRARHADGTRTAALDSIVVPTIARDYRRHHFGILLDQQSVAVQRRANVFAQGPSHAEGSTEVAGLLRRYLGPPPVRVIDVGCGFGSYGRRLLAEGYQWLGVEVDEADCAELTRAGLPHQRVDGRTLPFADGAFDAGLCLEVLEHIDEPRAFLAEVRRVAPRQLIVSVPNCELLGYLSEHLATPWHMLEADHKNFFTRWSLGALLRDFYAHVELRFHTPYPLRTREGTPLYYHVFAVATTPA